MNFGSVPYLNSKPLVHGLPSVEFLPPAQLADRFMGGAFDAALIPVVEAFSHPDIRVVDGVAIGSKRMVRSVIIAYNKPMYEVHTIALDPASRTSAALARVVMERDYGREITWVEEGEPADAQLIIGDRALEYRAAHPEVRVLDLARAWHDRRKLPFVFAVWAISPLVADPAPIRDAILAAKKQGLKCRNQIARNPDELVYLTENISYDVGRAEKEGIQAFQRELIQIGQLKHTQEIVWI
jgi:chorismate dehydratase